MRRILPMVIAAALSSAPAPAQLTAYYTGKVREGSKDVPATAVFSLEAGRAAMVIRGTSTR